jgi:carotenoid cleavage dioxygenase-like enzyme
MKPGSSAPPMLYRWVIDQTSGRVTETQLDDRVVDFPRVADNVVGLKHQYGYCAAFAGSAPYGEGLIKYDLEAGTSEYRHLDGGQASEAVFVKDPSASGEDGGFLLSYVYQPEIDQSEVLILNAQDMLGEPVARIQLPVRVPAGFHGNWIGD